jgi:hypothetical protein
MRKASFLALTLVAGTLMSSALHSQAVEPGVHSGSCNVQSFHAGTPCVTAKTVRTVQPTATASSGRVAKAALDRNVCGRLQTQVERDTCLNRVEATV